jgi:hypothetical protein
MAWQSLVFDLVVEQLLVVGLPSFVRFFVGFVVHRHQLIKLRTYLLWLPSKNKELNI